MTATIASGELFLLNGQSGGELQPLPTLLNQNIRVIAAHLDRVYVATEPPVCPQGAAQPPCQVWCFKGDSSEAIPCPEFEAVEGTIRQIAVGDKHLLVLTHDGTLYSRGSAIYGSTGHGGAREVPEFRPIPALRDKKVKFVAAGPNFSIAITFEGDVFSWGQAFQGETGLFTQVEAVPRFAAAVTPFRVTEVSCGQSHVVARTETQQCCCWGDNSCGQLGIGQKSKPSYKPQLLESIPSQVLGVSAGWAHSVAVSTDGRAFTWGLNSHGQLGLGDTQTRMAPHLLHKLLDVHKVESVHAAGLLTIFRTAGHLALLCGQVPRSADAPIPEFGPHRPGNRDPEGCVLSPVAITMASGMGVGTGTSPSQLSEIVAFDRGAMAFARSTVYKVAPNLAPLAGGTQVQAFVTGLPFEPPRRHVQGERDAPLVQDTVPVKVRLKSHSPACDVIVPGRIVARNTVEFTTPNVGPTPLGAVVEQGYTTAVQLRVSIDNGFTWTPDRYVAPSPAELERTTSRRLPETSLQGAKQMQRGLKDLKSDFEVNRKATNVAQQSSTVLWFCRWPEEGPSHVEPCCAPVSGGTELLLHVPLPPRMPADALTVKFLCTSVQSVDDPELEGRAPMRRDASEIINPCPEAVAKLPLAGSLEVPVVAWLDPAGQGVRCVSPPFDADSVRFYEYAIELSLDGRYYLKRALPFGVFDVHVTGLEPASGPVTEPTEVRIKATGLVPSDIHKVKLDFPSELKWPARTLPAEYDHTTGEISFMMPDLSNEVRQRQDEARATAAELAAAVGAERAAEDGEGGGGAVQVDPSGGLAGIEVFVELSLNAQNFTEDRIHFTYYGGFQPETVRIVAKPPGAAEEPPPDPKQKPKPGNKAAPEQDAEVVVQPGSKIGCTAAGLAVATAGMSQTSLAFAVLRAEVAGKASDGELRLFRVVDLAAKVEQVAPPQTAAEAAQPGHEEPPPVDMVTAFAPGIRVDEVPEGTTLFIRAFQVSLNGQSFESCPDQPLMRLELLPASPTPTQ